MPIAEENAERARRNRVNELADDLAELVVKSSPIVHELLTELQVDFRDFSALLVQRISGGPAERLKAAFYTAVTKLDPSAFDGTTDPSEAFVAGAAAANPKLNPKPPYRDVDPPDEEPLLSAPHTHQSSVMFQIIDRLLDEAPVLRDNRGEPVPDQTRAIQAHVMLRAGPTIQGSLSTCEDGGLKMLTPTELPDPTPINPRGTKIVLAESYFDYSDVILVAVQREVTATPGSSIFSSS